MCVHDQETFLVARFLAFFALTAHFFSFLIFLLFFGAHKKSHASRLDETTATSTTSASASACWRWPLKPELAMAMAMPSAAAASAAASASAAVAAAATKVCAVFGLAKWLTNWLTKPDRDADADADIAAANPSAGGRRKVKTLRCDALLTLAAQPPVENCAEDVNVDAVDCVRVCVDGNVNVCAEWRWLRENAAQRVSQ